MMNISQVLEALLFASDEPLTLKRLKEVLIMDFMAEEAPAAENQQAAAPAQESAENPEPVKKTPRVKETDARLENAIHAALAGIKSKYSNPDSPVVMLEVAEGWQLATNPVYVNWVKKLFKNRLNFRLSQAALETLSIIAYRQPITRAEIEQIRGVEVIASLETVIERGLVRVAGRRETVGRPLLYATSPEFLRQFGLRSLNDLPPLDSTVLNEQAGEVPEPVAAVVENE